MLAAKNRLRKPYEIARVYKKGVYGGAEGVFSIKVVANNQPLSRVVVVVGKKVDKRAVVRNRNRRRLIGQLQEIWATVPAGYDIVISVHSDTSALTPARLRQLLTDALRRARVISS